MNKKKHMIKQWQAFALAGMIGAGVLFPAGTAFAIGPGETESSQTEGTQTAAQTNPNTWKKVNGVYQMPDGSAIQNVLARGIDVSRWQGNIDWNQVAADDVSFVMLGTRSKGAVDPYFHKNIQEASAAGVQVGVYIYSLATTPEMAAAEADFVLSLIHDYPVSFPVAFDMEDDTQGILSKDELAVIANTFCGRIADAGYYPVIYANEYWLNNKLDMSKMDYPVWVARYSARPTYSNPVLWQATSTGSVNGISGNVDIDFQFQDFSSVIPANTWRTINGNTYYYQNYVKQKNSWVRDENNWYYMDSEGLTAKGWLTLSGKSFYLDQATGKMLTGWKEDSGKWYYLDSSGAMSRGWIKDNEKWYYADSEGVMQTGWREENGRHYFLDSSGAMAVGWTKQNDQWYYLDSSGVLQKGWINDNGSWYYSNSEGVMQTGWLEDAEERYYLKGSGVMATGWREMDGAWYYFESSGRMAKGMIQVDGLHYYMDPSTGRMIAATTTEIDGTSYQADENGVLSQVVQETENIPSNDGPQESGGTDNSVSAGDMPGNQGEVTGPGV